MPHNGQYIFKLYNKNRCGVLMEIAVYMEIATYKRKYTLAVQRILTTKKRKAKTKPNTYLYFCIFPRTKENLIYNSK